MLQGFASSSGGVPATHSLHLPCLGRAAASRYRELPPDRATAPRVRGRLAGRRGRNAVGVGGRGGLLLRWPRDSGVVVGCPNFESSVLGCIKAG